MANLKLCTSVFTDKIKKIYERKLQDTKYSCIFSKLDEENMTQVY